MMTKKESNKATTAELAYSRTFNEDMPMISLYFDHYPPGAPL
jgi:hypothetical protein